MNPRREAEERLHRRREVRVLEPSPPAVNDGPWLADDPADPAGAVVVGPVSDAAVSWDALTQDDAELAAWCAERWLGAWRRLGPLPPDFTETRLALHRLAEEVVSPARAAANGKIGLRYTRGGFGTPYFGADEQMRVEGGDLVRISNGRESREALEVDASPLGEIFGFGASILEELRARHGREARVQLWPEHFDLATDVAGATVGVSPGDDEHAEPYVYVLPQVEYEPGELWNATAFPGAELLYAELLAAGDQRGHALSWVEERLDALRSSAPRSPGAR